MKYLILFTLMNLLPFVTTAQSSDSKGSFGFALNSSVNGELYPIRIVPSLTYIKEKNQLELGLGFNPFSRKSQKLMSGEFNYKYFPNGTEHKFNMYLIARFSYIKSARDTYYPTDYNYLFLNGGYGIEITAFKKVYLGTNISTGLYTYSNKSDIPYAAFASQKLFDTFRFNLSFQFNVGYRF
ncbi:hypothetical protein [Marivirga harenae]|uniref:hypothetical protein n=1 Tax=Marivirga harenae TaxID=2010992 RepID=UPI0026DF95F0|nr:hypothetical protein [Marivirga harenae]WKV10613.1 hypothetical protein Q3Y49_10340 [Marivirga harenae]